MKIRLFTLLMAVGALTTNAEDPIKIEAIDIKKFITVSQEASEYRKTRMIPIEKFNQLAKQNNTIILDSRSKAAFEKSHIQGAINLNFSDFTEQKLAAIIPNKTTRILIYCNNNFESNLPEFLDKSPALALNIPTFINLYGYGYKNIYELDGRLSDTDKRVKLVGTSYEN